MNGQDRVYTLEIAGKPVLAFPARSFREAQSLLKEEWLKTDLRETKSDGAPLWDGSAKLSVRNADGAESARFAQEVRRVDADDLPIVYLVPLS